MREGSRNHDHVTSAPSIRALVADDDPASCRFLGDGLRAMGCDATACHDGPSALALARAESFDLLLVDCHMPGAGAFAIVQALRADPHAASHAAAAVATSAELAPGERRALLLAGCNGILDKPCTLVELRYTLGLIPTVDSSLLDDEAGLRTSGDYATLDALRQLLYDELSALEEQIEAMGKNPPALLDRLHRLRAACGFCGTTRLAHAAQKLKLELDRSSGHAAAFSEFHFALTATRQALHKHLRTSTARAGHGQHVP